MTVLTTPTNDATIACARGAAARARGLPAHAIAWFQEALRRDPTMGEAAFQAGELCLWHGRAEEAEQHLAQAMSWALHHPLGGPPPSATRGMDPDAARIALFAAIHALESAGLTPFLNGGTALGCVREGGFIGFDTDIDLAVAPGTDPGTVIEAIAAASGLRFQYHDVFAGAVLRVRFVSDAGIGGDVFLYQSDGEDWWCGVQRGPIAVRWRDTPFGVVEAPFLDRTVLLPHPAERYLEENYGDWRRPDPYHVAAFSAPNLIGDYGAMPRCAAYRAICLALMAGARDKATHLCREVTRRDPADPHVRMILA